VRFWDTSAIVPLLVSEAKSATARQLAGEDPGIIVWWATRAECVAALARRRREGALTSSGERLARSILTLLAAEWSEVLPGDGVRERAERLLSTHALRTADAFQLAAALLWSRGDTHGLEFVSLDLRLREAALREGFQLLPV
jgi:predicted nucleic acid-binding protein